MRCTPRPSWERYALFQALDLVIASHNGGFTCSGAVVLFEAGFNSYWEVNEWRAWRKHRV